MEIVIINRKGENVEQVKYFDEDIAPDVLIAALWNIPEADHSTIWRKENHTAFMSEAQANDWLAKQGKKDKPGKVTIGHDFIKHDNAKKYVGLGLFGEKGAFGVIWEKIVIDQEKFLKHRKEYTPNKLLDDMMVRLTQDVFVKRAKKQAKKGPETDKPGGLRPDTPPPLPPTPDVSVEPIDEPDKPKTNPKQKVQSLLKSPWLHALGTSALSGIALFFAKVAHPVNAMISVGVGALVWGLESLYHWRKKSFDEAFDQYENMSPTEISKLDDTTKRALHSGLNAHTWGGWGASVFDLNAWKQWRTYGAGLRAAQNDDDFLAKNIRIKAKI